MSKYSLQHRRILLEKMSMKLKMLFNPFRMRYVSVDLRKIMGPI